MVGDENSAGLAESNAIRSTSSSKSDLFQLTAPVGQHRRRAENPCRDNLGPPPDTLATASLLDRFSKNVRRALPSKEGEDSRGYDEKGGSGMGEIRGSEDQQDRRFDLAYEKYHSYIDRPASKRPLFSTPIIAVDQVTRGVQRPEDCKEPLHSMGKQQPSTVCETCSASSSDGVILDTPDVFTRTTSKSIDNSKVNGSLPSSPQRSTSSTTTSDGGNSSIFLEMAKRLHRLRLAAVTGNYDEKPASSIMVEDSGEDGLLAARSISYNTLIRDKRAPSLRTVDHDHHWPNDQNLGLSQPQSAAASVSDLSVASFCQLPDGQRNDSDVTFLESRLQRSSSSLNGSKIWSSEPFLAPNDPVKVGSENNRNGKDSVENNGLTNHQWSYGIMHRRQEDYGNRLLSMQPMREDPKENNGEHRGTSNIEEHRGALSRPIGFTPGSNDMQNSQRRRHYSPYDVSQLPTARTFSAEDVTNGAVDGLPSKITARSNPPAHADFKRPSNSTTTADSKIGAMAVPCLPPLPPAGRMRTKYDRLTSLETRNGISRILPSNGLSNGSVDSTSTLPTSATRLMEAIAHHPSGDLDYATLKATLSKQKRSYKRRLEREKAKREALENLLVKINTPRFQDSHSNSSNASTMRSNLNRKNITTTTGRSLADLTDVVISSLQSNSSDANSTSSEDAVVLGLIQQYMKMKQALLGRLERRSGQESTMNSDRERVNEGPNNLEPIASSERRFSKPGITDEDDIPIGGEAASGTSSRPAFDLRQSQSLYDGRREENGATYYHTLQQPLTPLSRSKSLDTTAGRTAGLNGVVSKEELMLALDTSSIGGSENGRQSPSTRKQRKKWGTAYSGRVSATDMDMDRPVERVFLAPTNRSAASTTTSRPPVAFFVSTAAGKTAGKLNGLVELKTPKPLQEAFRARQSRFVQRSISRQDRIRAASELRAEMSLQRRELAENVAAGRIGLEEASEKLLLYELPAPSAFPPSEMFRASKMKYEQLPETVARRNKLRRESDLATNRILAKMFIQKMAYKGYLKRNKQKSQRNSSTISSSLISTNRSNLRVFSG